MVTRLVRVGITGGHPVTLTVRDSFGQMSPKVGAYCFTITWKLHVVALLQASIAVQRTALVPSGNALPEAGEQLVDTTVPELSVALTV